MTAVANTKTTSEMPAFAERFREQLVSNIQQGQQLSIEAAQTWMNALSVLPVVELPKIHGIPAVPDVAAATKYTFDVASDLLSSQRAFALSLAGTLVPQKAI